MKHLKTYETATIVDDAENQFNTDITNLITSYKSKLSNEQITGVLKQISGSVYDILNTYDANNSNTTFEPTTQVKLAQPTSTRPKDFASQAQPTYKK